MKTRSPSERLEALRAELRRLREVGDAELGREERVILKAMRGNVIDSEGVFRLWCEDVLGRVL